MRRLSEHDEARLPLLQSGGLIFGRDDLQCVRVSGPDAAKFLHNMLTQDVRGLTQTAALPTCLCDAQGAILAVAELVRDAEGVDLWTERQDAQGLLESLDRYLIMDNAEIALDDDRTLVSVVGPVGAKLAAEAGADEPGQVVPWLASDIAGVYVWQPQRGDLAAFPALVGEQMPAELTICLPRTAQEQVVAALAERGASIGSHGVWEAFRVARGLVRLRDDIRDASLPLEVGLRHTVNYKKGCYLGQEAIAMMTYRGQIRRHTCWLRAPDDQPLPADWCEAGWILRTPEGKKAGLTGTQLRWSGGYVGLAMVQRKAYAEGARLVAEGPDGQQVQVQVVTTTVPQALAVQKADAPDLA